MIDIVYIVGKGSKWNNNELKFSLRSIEKYLTNYRKVWIIGDCPSYISNVEKIYYIEKSDVPSVNIMNKIRFASEIPDISRDFLLFNDDYFLTQPMDALKVEHYFDGGLLDRVEFDPTNWYNEYLTNTCAILKLHELECKNFDIHYPMPIRKDKFLSIMKFFEADWEHTKKLLVKSLYANALEIEGEFLSDCKIRRPKIDRHIDAYVKEKPMFSISDEALTETMKKYIINLYPEVSKFEQG